MKSRLQNTKSISVTAISVWLRMKQLYISQNAEGMPTAEGSINCRCPPLRTNCGRTNCGSFQGAGNNDMDISCTHLSFVFSDVRCQRRSDIKWYQGVSLYVEKWSKHKLRYYCLHQLQVGIRRGNAISATHSPYIIIPRDSGQMGFHTSSSGVTLLYNSF